MGQGSYAFSPHHEIVGRHSRIYALQGADASLVGKATDSGNEVGAGTNWYVNGHRFKVQADLIALFGEPSFVDAQHTIRAQVDVTF